MTAPISDRTNYLNPPGFGPLRPGGVEAPGIIVAQSEADYPNHASKAVKAQRPALAIVRDVAGGDERIKACGTTYLPQAEAEAPKDYRVRLARSLFTGFYKRAVEAYVGQLFAKDPKLGDDVPAIISQHWENLDLAGTHADVFLQRAAEDALIAGHGLFLVDFPDTTGAQTLADERNQTFPIRPYWLYYAKEQILSWRTAIINGAEVLSQLVLLEATMVANGAFGEAEQVRYRVLRREDDGRITWQLWQEEADHSFTLVDEGLFRNQVEIPVVEVWTSGRKSLFVSEPPLIDLAKANIAYYQASSDYAYALYRTCNPLLVQIGIDPTDGSGPVVVGANSGFRFQRSDADVKYVEPAGTSLAECRAALELAKADMAMRALQVLAPDKRAAETATAKRLSKSTTDSVLAVCARGLADAIERGLGFHARYLGIPDGGSVEINRDYDILGADAQMISALGILLDRGNFPPQFIIEEMQRLGAFPGKNAEEMAMAVEAEREARAELRRLESGQTP
jgi:hypothetical protein